MKSNNTEYGIIVEMLLVFSVRRSLHFSEGVSSVRLSRERERARENIYLEVVSIWYCTVWPSLYLHLQVYSCMLTSSVTQWGLDFWTAVQFYTMHSKQTTNTHCVLKSRSHFDSPPFRHSVTNHKAFFLLHRRLGRHFFPLTLIKLRSAGENSLWD